MLQGLDHVTIRSADLGATIRFYESVLGLRRGPRPAFAVPGCWLYAAGRPVLHVLGPAAVPAPAGPIDHVAFAATGRTATEAALRAAGVPFDTSPLPDGTALQLRLRDPDGVRLELVFHAEEDR